jgi:hypothetical protein
MDYLVTSFACDNLTLSWNKRVHVTKSLVTLTIAPNTGTIRTIGEF